MAILNHPATGAKNMQPDPAVVEAAVLFSSFLFFLAEGRADGGVECQRTRRFCTYDQRRAFLQVGNMTRILSYFLVSLGIVDHI